MAQKNLKRHCEKTVCRDVCVVHKTEKDVTNSNAVLHAGREPKSRVSWSPVYHVYQRSYTSVYYHVFLGCPPIHSAFSMRAKSSWSLPSTALQDHRETGNQQTPTHPANFAPPRLHPRTYRTRLSQVLNGVVLGVVCVVCFWYSGFRVLVWW